MCADLTMTKRQGRPGEVGLFVDSPVFEEDFANIKMNAEVLVKATTPRSMKQHRFAWALASKMAEAYEHEMTKEDMMEALLIEARHTRKVWDPLRGKAELKARPTNFGAMDGVAYSRLLKRITYVATTVFVPGLPESDLKSEIESMIAPTGDFR